jgi:hypothetical protein
MEVRYSFLMTRRNLLRYFEANPQNSQITLTNTKPAEFSKNIVITGFMKILFQE